MEQLDFQGGGSGASSLTEAMQGVVKLDHRCEVDIQHPFNGLTEYLNHPDAADVAIKIWYQDNGLPGTLLCKVTLAEICLDQANGHLEF